jgi:hypothetical protein
MATAASNGPPRTEGRIWQNQGTDLSIQPPKASAFTTYPWPGFGLTQSRRTFINEIDGSVKTVDVYVAVVDLSTPGVRLTFPVQSGTRDVVRETTEEFIDRIGAVFGVDTHFFQPYPSDDLNANLIGFAVSEGVVISPFVAQPPDEPGGPYVDQGYAIVDYAPAINISPDNHASIVHRDPSDAENKSVIEDVELWTAFSGSAQIITNGYVTIPTYAPTGPLKAISGYSNSNSWYDLLRARSGVGISQDGRKLIFATGDLLLESMGMTVRELAQVLMQHGAYQGLNTDGGGSSSMVLRSPYTNETDYVNKPSNGYPRQTGGNLAVYLTHH